MLSFLKYVRGGFESSLLVWVLYSGLGAVNVEDTALAQQSDRSSDTTNTVPSLEASNSVIESQESKTGRIKLEGAILKTIDSTSVSAQVAGVLSESKLREGALVRKGQVLAGVHDASIRLKLDQLKLQWDMAQRKKVNAIDRDVASKNRQVADTEYERALVANKRVPNTYPLNEVDRLKLVSERSLLEEQRAEYNMEMAALEADITGSEYAQIKELLSRHTITTPVDGMIVAVEKKLGEWVEPGTEVFRIVRTDTLRIEGLIPALADDGLLVDRLASVELVRSDRRQKFVGKVVFVSPDVNPINSLVRVFIEVENPDRILRPGLQVHAEISLDRPIARELTP